MNLEISTDNGNTWQALHIEANIRVIHFQSTGARENLQRALDRIYFYLINKGAVGIVNQYIPYKMGFTGTIRYKHRYPIEIPDDVLLS